MSKRVLASFSSNNQHYAHISKDGKLRIWDVSTNTLKQEYTPDLHLASPFTELKWISTKKVVSNIKKKKVSNNQEGEDILLGTRSGNILIYSVSNGNVVDTLKGHHSHVNSITWCRNVPDQFYSSGEDQFIFNWDLSNKTAIRKWKCGKISCLALSPNGDSLVAGKKEIIWWNTSSHENPVKTFIGHATDIVSLVYVHLSGKLCVLSAATGNRVIHAWVLDDNDDRREATATFNMDDSIVTLSALTLPTGEIDILAAINTGGAQFFSCTLNGNNAKPIKPKLTIQIAEGDEKSHVAQLPIISVSLCDHISAYMAYGSDILLAFEKLNLESSQNTMFLIRRNPMKIMNNKQSAATKVMPVTPGKNTQYVHPTMMNGVSSTLGKRSRKNSQCSEKTVDVPLEVRLDNLSVDLPSTSSSVPSSDSLVHLLLQGLRGKDAKLLKDALVNKDEAVIRKTIYRLPVEAILPLSTELILLLQGKPDESDAAAKWLKLILVTHSAHLISNVQVCEVFSPAFSIIESRLNMLPPLCKLAGRLDIMIEQIDGCNNAVKMQPDSNIAPKLVYQDEDSEDGSGTNNEEELNASDNEVSDENWNEISDLDESEPEDIDMLED